MLFRFQGEQSEDCAGRVYESLEEIHVLALAHVLRRPIIVVADLTLKVSPAWCCPVTLYLAYLCHATVGAAGVAGAVMLYSQPFCVVFCIVLLYLVLCCVAPLCSPVL